MAIGSGRQKPTSRFKIAISANDPRTAYSANFVRRDSLVARTRLLQKRTAKRYVRFGVIYEYRAFIAAYKKVLLPDGWAIADSPSKCTAILSYRSSREFYRPEK